MSLRSFKTQITPIFFTRIAALSFIYSGVLTFNALHIQSIGSGIGIYSGLFQVTYYSLFFESFLYAVGAIILLSWPLFYRIVGFNLLKSNFSTAKHSILKTAKDLNIKEDFDLLKNSSNSLTGASEGLEFITSLTTSKESREYSLIALFSSLGGSLLLSSGDLLSMYLSIELQSFGRAPYDACIIRGVNNNSIHSVKLAVLYRNVTDHGFSPYCKPITYYIGIAGNKYEHLSILPCLEVIISGCSHGQDNKSETYKGAHDSLCILSRISRYIYGNLKAFDSSPNIRGSQETIPYFNKKSKNAQRPKTTLRISETINTLQLRDLTASNLKLIKLLRRRSLHTSSLAKGDSHKSLSPTSLISDIKDTDNLNPSKKGKGSTSKISVSMKASLEINKYMNKDLKYNGLINIIADPIFLWACYDAIKSKPGNMSQGITHETLDGIKGKWFQKTSQDLKSGKFEFKPARRVLIPKPGKSENRPLGIGSPRDKIIQKAISAILESIWEKSFLDVSYGFRPGKSLHQALYKLYRNGSNYQWVIQGDISKCFDQIPHKKIREVIQKKVQCQKTLKLINKSLSAGYIDPVTNEHLSPDIGTPQGSVLSPLLSNIVLHELDLFMAKVSKKFNQGTTRDKNPEYSRLQSKIQWLQKSNPGSPEIKELVKERRTLPSSIAMDPKFKRLMYIRYADDFVILIAGSKNDALLIKS